MDYPSILPMPSNSGYGREVRIKMNRTRMDDGSSRVRRMFPNLPYTMKLTFNYSPSQLAIFDAFIKYDCVYGTKWFKLKVRADKPAVSVKITGDAPSTKPLGYDFEVSFSVLCMDDLTGAAPGFADYNNLASWPANIPLPEKDDYSTQISNFNLEDNMDQGGMPNSRSRFTTKEVVFQASWLLSAAERDRFFTFIKYNLADGHLPVLIPFYNGLGIRRVKCWFAEFPTEQASGAAFRVGAKMATIDAPVMSEQAYRLQVPRS